MTGILIFFMTLAILIFYMALNKRGIILKITTITGVVIIFFLAWLYARNIGRDVNQIDPWISTRLKSYQAGKSLLA